MERSSRTDQLEPTPAVMDIALDTVEQTLQGQLAACAIGDAGAVHHDEQQLSQRIHDNMAFTSAGLLMHVHAARFTAFRRFHALAINADGAGLRVAPHLWACLLHQHFIDARPQPAADSAPEIAIHRLPWRPIAGQHPPLTAGAGHLQNGVDDQPQLSLSGAASPKCDTILLQIFTIV